MKDFQSRKKVKPFAQKGKDSYICNLDGKLKNVRDQVVFNLIKDLFLLRWYYFGRKKTSVLLIGCQRWLG